MSDSDVPAGGPPAAVSEEDVSGRYLRAIRALFDEAVERRELADFADALARAVAGLVSGCASLPIAGDMLRRIGAHLVEMTSEPPPARPPETRPEGATLH